MKKEKDDKDPNKNYKNEETGEIDWCGDGRTICYDQNVVIKNF